MRRKNMFIQTPFRKNKLYYYCEKRATTIPQTTTSQLKMRLKNLFEKSHTHYTLKKKHLLSSAKDKDMKKKKEKMIVLLHTSSTQMIVHTYILLLLLHLMIPCKKKLPFLLV